MNNLIYLLILTIISGCSYKELTVADLKFDNIERTYIKANHIRESVITYDSSTLYKSIQEGTLDRDAYITYFKDGYGTGYIKYDSNGNIIERYTREFMGTGESYKYDSLQMPIQKDYETDFTARYTIQYFFDNEKLMLFQYWKYRDDIDTTIFTFNNKGYIISETGRLHDDKSTKRLYKKEYFYKEDTLLNKITCSYTKGLHTLYKTEELITYKNGLINVREMSYEYLRPNNEDYHQVKKESTIFDEKGLPIKLIITGQNGNPILKNIRNQ